MYIMAVGLLVSYSSTLRLAILALIGLGFISLILRILIPKNILYAFSAVIFIIVYILNNVDSKNAMEENCHYYQVKCMEVNNTYGCYDEGNPHISRFYESKIRKCIEMGFIKNNKAL